MSIFDKLKDDTDILILKINNFNPEQMDAEYSELLQNYSTPNRSYITVSARGISADEVEVDTLQYIIKECFKCSEAEKYQATIIVIHKLFQKHNDLDLVQEAKEELTLYLLSGTVSENEDMSFLDKHIGDYTDNFFYIIEISIGTNHILKYGITNSLPRKRFAKIKSSIKEKYTRQRISIKPLVLVYCPNVGKFEDIVKVSMSEQNIYQTNYQFAGATETFSIKDKTKMLDILNMSSETLPVDAGLEILYDEIS
jgi:predicted nucleic-acid-binding Zn-ribbon protein